jgi:peptidoglycan glycosyltransferase
VNQQVVRIFALALLLLGLLVAWTSRWTTFEAEELEARAENRRALIAEQQIRRGSISTADGVVVAESRPRGGPQTAPVYVRRYPQGTLFGNPVGYNYVNIGRSGIEQSLNDLLVGERNEFTSIIDQLRGRTREGADVTLTINAEVQRLAVSALQSAVASTAGSNGAGSVVAIEPDTGAVLVMASIPGYDPNDVRSEQTFSQLAEQGTESPLFNRPTQGVYEPGSTMKVVTAAAALDSGNIDPGTVLTANSPMPISGVPLSNAGGQSFGPIDATTALTNSVNTYWAQVGERLGTDTYIEYMDRFGFNADPELDYPPNQMAPSGVYESGRLLGTGDLIDIGRASIGQERLLTSPLQMAQAAGVIANGGVLMEPTFLQEASDPDGRTLEELDPTQQDRVISEEAASQVAEMMTNVTREGTASGLSVGGVEFAGKTGTAEIDVEASINRPWFIGFAPAQDPQVAIAVMLERCTGCFGGEVAGPIGTEVMEALLR